MTWRLAGRAGGGGKYGAKRSACRAGAEHASAAEARRCDDLHVLQAGGAIRELRAHPQRVYDLVVNGVPICRYIADFEYLDSDGRTVVEDVKGYATRGFRIKARLMRACHGIEVREVPARAARRARRR